MNSEEISAFSFEHKFIYALVRIGSCLNEDPNCTITVIENLLAIVLQQPEYHCVPSSLKIFLTESARGFTGGESDLVSEMLTKLSRRILISSNEEIPTNDEKVTVIDNEKVAVEDIPKADGDKDAAIGTNKDAASISVKSQPTLESAINESVSLN